MSALQQPGKHSPHWKRWRAVGEGKSDAFFLEHAEAVLESLDSPTPPQEVLLGQALFDREPARWEALAAAHRQSRWFLLPDDRLDKVVSVRSVGGLCGLYEPRLSDLAALTSRAFLLVTWEIQDPGNFGTLVRSCGALASGGVLAVGGCRPWSSKTARSSAGAILRVPCCRRDAGVGETVLRELQAAGFRLLSAVPRGGQPVDRFDWSTGDRHAVLVGHETRGLPVEIQNLTELVTIGMRGEEESLNAAVAGSILCYEWSRSRLEVPK